MVCLNLVCHKFITHINPMNEERIGLYLELIEKLLSCSSGEEPGILQAHQKL